MTTFWRNDEKKRRKRSSFLLKVKQLAEGDEEEEPDEVGPEKNTFFNVELLAEFMKQCGGILPFWTGLTFLKASSVTNNQQAECQMSVTWRKLALLKVEISSETRHFWSGQNFTIIAWFYYCLTNTMRKMSYVFNTKITFLYFSNIKNDKMPSFPFLAYVRAVQYFICKQWSKKCLEMQRQNEMCAKELTVFVR